MEYHFNQEQGLTWRAMSVRPYCKVLNVVTCFGITVGYLIFIASTAQSMLPAAMAGPAHSFPLLLTILPVLCSA